MRRKLTLLLLTFALVITLMPTRAFQQGRSGAQIPQKRERATGKVVDSYRGGQSGARPAWVDTALGRSLAHFRGEGAKHGLANADAELSLLSALRDDLGQTHVRLKQVHKGVPVFGGQLIAHLDRDDPDERNRNFANGRIFKDVRGLSTRPSITSASALKSAKNLLGREGGFERENVELVVLPEAIRLGNDAFGATLTYKVELLVNNGDEAARHNYFIDARNGSLIWNYDNLQTGLGRGLYAGEVGIGTDAFTSTIFRMRDQNRTNGFLCGLTGILTSDFPTGHLCSPYTDSDDIWGNFQPFNIQSAAVDAHYFSALTFDYFMGFHGRNSLDGNGYQMCNRMRNNSAGVNNAFWDGQCTNYGQGSSARHLAPADVVGHEYTHGLTEFTADLIYAEQSGGSNESYSDIFGTMVEFFWGGNPDYLLGEDIAPPIRNMANPRSIPPSIDHFSQFFPGMDPHFSSGLQNVVFYLMSESGNHPTTGVFVKKIGRQRAANVFFRALVMYLGPSSTFADVRQGVELATRDLYSTGNPIWNAVRKAWFSAGVGSDVPFNQIDTSSGFVAQHYRDFLLREGDAGGIAWWASNIDQCGSDAACEDGMRTNVSRAFWDSMDFQARPDVQASGLLTGNPAQPYNHHQFIRYCYLNYLQREPDPGGWAFWEAHLNSHGDYNALIRAFLYSGEYRSRFGPA